MGISAVYRIRIVTSAFVNAELVRVTAPIAGRLTRDLSRKGDFIEQAAAVTLIEALSRDQRHLLDLGSKYAVAKGRSDLARKQLAEIAAADRDFEERTQTYRNGMIERFGHEQNETGPKRPGVLQKLSGDARSAREWKTWSKLASRRRFGPLKRLPHERPPRPVARWPLRAWSGFRLS